MNGRLKKEPVLWTHEHTRAVQKIKARVKTLPILYVADDDLPKIVETDASNEGWGAVLKQVRIKENKKKSEEGTHVIDKVVFQNFTIPKHS